MEVSLNQLLELEPELFCKTGSPSEQFSVLRHRLVYFLTHAEWVTDDACLERLSLIAASNPDAVRQCDVQKAFNKAIAQRYPTYASTPKQPLPAKVLKSAQACTQFVIRFIKSPNTIGSVFPSSPSLVQKITRMIPPFNAEDSVSRHILEIGAGTGTFTEEIIKKLKLSDHLDIVELDPDLCKILRERFSHHPNVTIHEISILDFSPSNQYDFVVSGLPLNIFPSTFVEKVLEKYTDLTKQKGTLSYFEYMAIGKIKRAGLNFFGRGQDFSLVLTKKEEFKRKAKAVTVDTVLLNLTPARVIHCVL